MLGFQNATIKRLIEYALRSNEQMPGHRITRLAMYKALGGIWASADSTEKVCLAISGSHRLGAILGLTNVRYEMANYPSHNVIDLKAFREAQFDFCISDQVLEHVEGDPSRAIAECARVVKPGGLICHTTCFINPIHGHPSDFWRFTPEALSLLSRQAGLTDIVVGGWGNREAWSLVHAGYRMATIPDDESHPLYLLGTYNEPAWPIVTWVTCRKP